MSAGQAIAAVDPIGRTQELFAGWMVVTREAIAACQRGDYDGFAQTLEARAAIAREVDEVCAAVRRTLETGPETDVKRRLRSTMSEAAELERTIGDVANSRCTALRHELKQQQRGLAAVHAYSNEGLTARQLDRRS